MNFPLFIAKKLYSDQGDKRKVSRPAIHIATAGVAIGLAHFLLLYFPYERKNLFVLRTELANGLGSTPHLLVVHSLQLCVQLLTIVGLRVAVDRDLSLVASLN